MRGLLLSTLTLLGLGWLTPAQAQDDVWIPRHDEFRPVRPNYYGYTADNNYEFHRPHLYRHYYTPPSRMPGGQTNFGYTPHDSFRYRPTRQFNFYHFDENGNPRW